MNAKPLTIANATPDEGEPLAPLRRYGLLGDCDLRWLSAVAFLCAILLHYVPAH